MKREDWLRKKEDWLRQVDALVAEDVMEATIVSDFDGIVFSKPTIMIPIKGEPDNPCFCAEYPHYSTDIAAAWEVVEKMQSLDTSVNIDVLHATTCVEIERSGVLVGKVVEETTPLAICLAFLQAKGIEIPPLQEETS